MSERALLDVTKVPFVFNKEQSIQAQGNTMGFILQLLARKDIPDKTWQIMKTCFSHIGISEDSFFLKISRDISNHIDKHTEVLYEGKKIVFSGCKNYYHNYRHMQEVVLNAMFLLSINEAYKEIDFSVEDKAFLLFSALIHDIGHDGTGNVEKGEYIPYRLEKISVDIVTPIIKRHMGLEAEEFIKKVRAIVYATDIQTASDFLKDILLYQRGILKSPPVFTEVTEVFSPLLSNKNLAEIAAMLCDADIAFSIAYNFACTWEASVNLSKEITGSDELALNNLNTFNDKMADIKSLAGEKLRPNFEVVKDSSKKMLKIKNLGSLIDG